MAKKENKSKTINIKNKRASFDFALFDDYTAGIVLTGTEIKSIRQGKASLVLQILPALLQVLLLL